MKSARRGRCPEATGSAGSRAKMPAGATERSTKGACVMNQYIGCDAHRKYSIFVSVDSNGKASAPTRVEHDREEFRRFLRSLPQASPVAVEASGGWYWLMTELEEAGLEPHLVHATEAKRRMRGRNKTDELD